MSLLAFGSFSLLSGRYGGGEGNLIIPFYNFCNALISTVFSLDEMPAGNHSGAVGWHGKAAGIAGRQDT
jgi:hypothetical protein